MFDLGCLVFCPENFSSRIRVRNVIVRETDALHGSFVRCIFLSIVSPSVLFTRWPNRTDRARRMLFSKVGASDAWGPGGYG